jgi:DNA-binding GntR family transcriptional regulator
MDRQDGRSLYHQVADRLRDEIELGAYQRGAVLPSEGELMKIYGVSRTSVRRALAVLRQEGLIVSARGTSTRVREHLPRREVLIDQGDELLTRMPTEHERIEHLIDHGVPMVEIRRRSGGVELLAGDRVVIMALP